MFADFLLKLFSAVCDKGYQPVEFRGKNAGIDETTRFFAWTKMEGSLLYAVCAYDVDRLNKPAFAETSEGFCRSMKSVMETYNLRNVIIQNILASKGENPDVISIVDEGEEFYGQSFFITSMGTSLENARVYFPKNQPEIDGVQQILRFLLASPISPMENRPTLEDLRWQAIERRRLRPRVSEEWAVYLILAVNAFIFALMEMNGGSTNNENLIFFGALYTPLVFKGDLYRLFMPMFVHIGYSHIIFNSITLFVFGKRVEKYFGTLWFILFYLVTGFFGNLVMLVTLVIEMSGTGIPTIAAGASGAIYGLIGATLSLTWITRKSIDGLNFYVILVFMVFGILMGFASTGVGNGAHVGGLVSGFLMGLIVAKRLMKRELKAAEQIAGEREQVWRN